MTTTLTDGAATVTPVQVLGFESARQTGNILHPVIGRADVDVTFKAAGLRTGTLKFLFLTLTDALAAESLHAGTGIITLEDTELPALNMRYVPSGSITVALDEDTRQLWTVEVEYQEVT